MDTEDHVTPPGPLDHIPTPAWRCDPQGTGDSFNACYLDFTGRPAAVARGSGWQDAMHPDDRATTRRFIALAAAGAVSFECRLRHADTTYHWLRVNAAPSAVAHVILVATDISDLIEARHVEERLREQADTADTLVRMLRQREYEQNLILDNIPVMILYKDTDNHVLRANRFAAEAMGFHVAEMEGRHTGACFPGEATALYRLDMDVLRSRAPVMNNVEQVTTRRGDKRWLRLHNLPCFDATGALTRIIVVAEDITAAQRHAEALRARMEESERLMAAQKEAEEALRRQKDEMQIILDNIPIMLWVKDDRNNILRVNRATAEYSGRTVAELTGVGTAEIYPDPEGFYWQEDLGIIQSGVPRLNQVMEVQVTGRDSLWLRYHKIPYFDAHGGGTHIIMVAQEITEEMRATAALRDALELARRHQYETSVLFDNVPVNVIFKDDNNHIIRGNKCAAEFFGVPLAELAGYDLARFMSGQAARILSNDREVIRSGRTMNDIVSEVTLPSGERRWLRTHKTPYVAGNGGVNGVLVVFQDITEEQARKRDLELAIDRLTVSNRELERFAHVASHDLKEPLRMVASYMALLEADHAHELGPEARQYLRFARDGALRMDTLLEDLLEYSRIGRQETAEPVECNTALAFARSNLRASIEERDASITHDELPVVPAHMLHLTRVFQNLIHNAIKYCAPERKPVIHITAHDEDGVWHFSVSDNGIGMRAADLTRIFEPFNRLHPRHTYPGSGIGLAICRRIIEGLDGKLWVESSPGDGSTFHFTLPKTA